MSIDFGEVSAYSLSIHFQGGKMRTIFLFFIVSILIIGCSTTDVGEKNQKNSDQIETTITENSSYTEVGAIKDLSYDNTKRIEALITIPHGRTEEEVEATLKRAAKEIGEREKPKALVVKGFAEGDKYQHGTYTAGEAIYAPNGKWEDASTSAPILIQIKLGSLYFQDEKASLVPQKNDEVTLVSKNNELIDLSKKRDSWGEEDIIAKLPAGKKAVVIERYEEALSPDYKLVRYLIKVDNLEGWVFDVDISL